MTSVLRASRNLFNEWEMDGPASCLRDGHMSSERRVRVVGRSNRVSFVRLSEVSEGSEVAGQTTLIVSTHYKKSPSFQNFHSPHTTLFTLHSSNPQLELSTSIQNRTQFNSTVKSIKMSDTGRKDFTEQVSDKITPDSQKSFTEKASENVSGTYDKAASSLQPESEKSTTQELGDSTRSGADDAQNDGKTYLESAQQTASDVTNVAADKVKAAADYVAGSDNSKSS